MEPTFFESQAEFRNWLKANHAQATELLVGFWKKGTGKPSLDWKQAVDEVLCFGWIDGKGKSLGEEAFTIRITPRKSKSLWSKRNVENVERLIREGRMTEAGMAEVERAKQDGRWDAAYAGPRESVVPPALIDALEASPKAKSLFEALNKTNRYAITWRLETAKKPETRAKRLKELVAMLERGETIHPQKFNKA